MTSVNLITNLWDDFALANYLGVRPSWVAAQARAGKIPCVRMGKYRRYDPDCAAFKQWLDSLRANQYDSAQSKKDGPKQEDQDMARSSYQKGVVAKQERKQGIVWVLRYRLRSVDGWIEKTEILPSATGKKDAREKGDERMKEINRLNSQPLRHSMTVKQFAEGLWAKYAERFKPSTAYSYDSWLKLYVLSVWGHRSLDSMMPEDITLFMEARKREKLSDKSLLNLYGLLNTFFSLAEEYEFLESNPVRRRLHRPLVEKQEKPSLSPEEIGRVIQAAPVESRALLATVAIIPLRLGELLALRWQDVDFINRRVMINHSLWRGQLVRPKTRASMRPIHLPASLVSVLIDHQRLSNWTEPGDFVFCNEQGRPLDPDNLRHRVLYPALETAGITRGSRTHGFHLFRHSAASIVYAETKALRPGQELLGHAAASTTAIYTHTERVAEEATEILAREIVGNCGLTVVKSWAAERM
jgi:integrase